MDKALDSETSVKVAIRIRPQNAREQVDMCRVCTSVTPNEPQVVLGKDKAFTYDYVFDMGTEQHTLYDTCVEELVEGCFSGLNATVLAYGQTGSGKTYTMGTGFDVTVLPEEQGAVPRAVHHLFQGITTRCNNSLSSGIPPPQFELTSQFLELYNEEIIDLFDTARDSVSSKKLKVHETNDGNIYVDGAIVHPVKSEEETLEALKQGALSRSVGSTNMNAQSSRSHAIFTLVIEQKRPILAANDGSSSKEVIDWETLTAKFHFVDLAGSERLKRTGATGERAKEGISINCGLLALGNVISALGDKSKKGSHVPYRDSKLTRLLQDSLGGNSQTLMIACVSPSDRDFMETLNTLKYANRARNIKNKVTVNQDKNSAQLAALHKRIQELELQIQEFQSGKLVVANDGSVVLNDLASENTLLKAENDKLRLRMKSMQSLLDAQSQRLAALQSERDMMALNHQDESTGQVMSLDERNNPHIQTVLQEYIQQIEDLRSQLVLSESQRDHFNSTSSVMQTPLARQRSQVHPEIAVNDVIVTARTNIKKLEDKLSTKKVSKSVRWKRRVRKRDRSASPERISTDVDEWISKSQTDLFASATDEDDKGSDTEINEDNSDFEEEEEEEKSDTESLENTSWSSESGEEEEPMDDTASIATSIAELSTEINIKQQLVDQLEKAQKSLQLMRSQYEEKMTVLQQQIRVIETERDKVIRNLSNRQSERQEEQMKELRDKYEKELLSLKRGLKQLQIARKEHALAMKKNAQQDNELRKIKVDLSEMKSQKVKLMRKLKEETSVYRTNNKKKEKEIARLRNDHRKKETLIKALQAEARKKEMMLKKKDEEVQALRRQQTSQSNLSKETTQQKRDRPSTAPLPSPVVLRKKGPAAKKARLQRRQSSMFTSDSARRKWRIMEKLINEIVNRRQTMNSFETDLDRWLQKREELSHRADQLHLQRDQLLQATEDAETLASIEEELEALTAQISWTNDSIEKLQEDIVTFSDTKAESETIETTALIHSSSTREAKYMLEHIVNMAIESGTQSLQKESEVKSLQMRLATSESHAELIKIYSSPHVPLSPLVVNPRTVSKLNQQLLHSTPFSSRGKPLNELDENQQEESTLTNELDQTFVKYRRRTATPAELKQLLHESPPKSFKLSVNNEGEEVKDQCDSNDETLTPPIATTPTTAWVSPPLVRKATDDPCSPKRLPMSKRRSVPVLANDERTSLPVPLNSHSSLSRLSSLQETSPSHETKSHFETERSSSRSSKFLICTHTIRGHSGGVLTLSAADNILVSGSQDCTAKVWDLITGQETTSLTKHHSYVRKVNYSPSTRLVFTACQSIIKGWDLRDPKNPEFMKALLPPGQTNVANSADTVVQDIVVNDNALFAAAGSAVQIWDLRQMAPIGRLVGHNGLVGTMATINDSILATGSRDRLIKLYDTRSFPHADPGFTQLPQATLSPAHYDTVTSLAVRDNTLYSSCGVSIKKWDMKLRSLVHAVDGAHPQSRGNAITSLDVFLPSLLVSTCKSGNLKMWLTDNCQNIGDISAHKMSINSVTVNQYSVFTGSSDKSVKIWRPNSSFLTQNNL